MGFAGEEENETAKEDWFKEKGEHTTLAGAYKNVNIYLTDKGFSSVRKWTRSDMIGALRMIQVKEVENYPVVIL